MIVHYAMKSRQGDRTYNEDTIQMLKLPDREIYVLADGLGGCGHGDLASETVVKSVINRARRKDFTEDSIKYFIEGAQNAVMEKKKMQPEFQKMSSTLVLLIIKNGVAQWGHIGDSRLYMFRKNKVIYQTLDHSVPQMLVRIGEITQRDIRKHPDRNRLLQTIGYPFSDSSYAISEKTQLNPGDAFLLCTDGFWEYIYEEEMCQILKKEKNVNMWFKKMEELVKERGKNENMDNFSAICIQVY